MDQRTAVGAQQIEQRPKSRGTPWPPGVSGNPSGNTTSKRATFIFESMLADFEGRELSGMDKALLMQAAQLMARAERARKPNDSVRLANAAARLLASLRDTKQKRDREPPCVPMREKILLDADGQAT